MAQNIKKIIAQEFIKCAKDPSYFMKKYCYIQHPTRGRILFNLYPFQSEVLHLFRDNDYIITLKSRQLGLSTLVAAYSVWMAIFQREKNILIIHLLHKLVMAGLLCVVLHHVHDETHAKWKHLA